MQRAFLTAIALLAGCRGVTSPPVSGPAAPAAAGRTPSGAIVCTEMRARGDAPLIDDFETEAARIARDDGRAGWWFSYDDGSGGQLVRERIDAGEGGTRRRVMHVRATGFKKWGAGFGASIHAATTPGWGCAYDASAYSGLRLRARGHGRLRLVLVDAAHLPVARGGACPRPSEACHDAPGVWLDLTESWTTYELPFCGFFAEGWGGTDGVDPARLVSFQFRVRAGEEAEAWLDDLAFYQHPPDAPAPRCAPPCPLEAVPRAARIAPAISTAQLTPELGVHTFEQPTTSCGPLTRRYLSFVPASLGPRSSAPVLIVLHGARANAESMRELQTRRSFDRLAARDRFIVVYGNAAPGPETRPDPFLSNSGVWRHGSFDDREVDDIDYLQRVVADLGSRRVISGSNPVFLAGMSNGGGMVLEAVRRRPERFSGVAALMPYDGAQPGPAPDLHGGALKRVLVAYSIDDPGEPERYHLKLAELTAAWAAALGVSTGAIAAPEKIAMPDTVAEGIAYRGTSAAALATRRSNLTKVDMAAGDRRMRVLILDHAGHFWPNPTPDTQDWVLDRWGFRNQDFDAAEQVWDFLGRGL